MQLFELIYNQVACKLGTINVDRGYMSYQEGVVISEQK